MPSQITPESAYPNAEQVMNRARAFVNDAFRGGQGRILTDQAPFSVEYLNAALEELQDRLSNNGSITLIKDNVILGPITPIPAVDPTKQVFISYTGYNDGTTNHATPVLPSDLRAIYEVWEQIEGSGLPFQPMMQPQGPLPSQYQGPYLGLWEYREDRLYMLGSTSTEQLRIRYESRQPVIASGSNLADTQIGILSSVNALATIVAYVYARARGAAALPVMQADAEKMMQYIVRRYVRRDQSINFQRRPYGQGAGETGNSPWGTNLPM